MQRRIARERIPTGAGWPSDLHRAVRDGSRKVTRRYTKRVGLKAGPTAE